MTFVEVLESGIDVLFAEAMAKAILIGLKKAYSKMVFLLFGWNLIVRYWLKLSIPN